MITTTENTNEQSFRTADDEKRLQHALQVITTMQATVDAARAALTAAEQAYAADSDAKALDRAKAARLELDGAERDLAYALHHASKVGYEVEAKVRERAALSAAIASR